MQDDEILAVLRPAPARRVALVLVASLLGVLLISVGMDAPEGGLALRIGFLVAGLGMIWAAVAVWQRTGVDLVLTTSQLRQSDGRVLCAMDDIIRVERGLAALRPATGFALELRAPAAPGWVPGLWWRRGRRLGIGGMTTRAGSKALADTIEVELRARTQAE